MCIAATNRRRRPRRRPTPPPSSVSDYSGKRSTAPPRRNRRYTVHSSTRSWPVTVHSSTPLQRGTRSTAPSRQMHSGKRSTAAPRQSRRYTVHSSMAGKRCTAPPRCNAFAKRHNRAIQKWIRFKIKADKGGFSSPKGVRGLRIMDKRASAGVLILRGLRIRTPGPAGKAPLRRLGSPPGKELRGGVAESPGSIPCGTTGARLTLQ